VFLVMMIMLRTTLFLLIFIEDLRVQTLMRNGVWGLMTTLNSNNVDVNLWLWHLKGGSTILTLSSYSVFINALRKLLLDQHLATLRWWTGNIVKVLLLLMVVVLWTQFDTALMAQLTMLIQDVIWDRKFFHVERFV
jgi:hypothetical protein